MYKYFIIILFFFISSCSENDNPFSSSEIMEFKNIAWNDLLQEELSSVIVTIEESKILYSKISRNNGIYYYKINNSELTFVITHPEVDYRTEQTFVVILINTSDDALLGPITVIIEPNSKRVFGRGARE